MYFPHSVIILVVFRSKRMSWAGRLALVGEKRNARRILVRKYEGKRPRRRLTGKLNYAIKRDINLLKPTYYVMHHQFNIQQLYALPTLY
jgi:hypothetical protein